MPKCSGFGRAGIISVFVALAGCSVTQREAAQPQSQPRPVVVAFLGDSLTSGAQLEPGSHYPALLERRFASIDLPVRCVNAGVPGDTTDSGLSRLEVLLQARPAILVVALGVNDPPKDIPPSQTASNLRVIVARAREHGAIVVMAAAKVEAPWKGRSADVVESVAREENVRLVEDLLAGVAGVPRLNLADGVHPNAAGQKRLANNVWPVLFPAVVEVAAARPRGATSVGQNE